MSNNELMSALEQIEKDQGISKDEILKMVEQALVSAYRKHAGQQVNVVAAISPASGQIQAYVVKNIVESVSNPVVEITAAEAARVRNGVVEGTELRIPVDARDFARIAAQTAKQVLVQKVRETQRESLYNEYKPKEGTMINGTVLRFLSRNIVVDLGRGSEAIMPVREQVRREHWAVGDRIRALILKVERSHRGPEIVLSRAHPDFVKRLFEQEVPEIYEKTVDVVTVVREPGFRSKVVVRTNNPKVDPVGACVGVKGSRVRPIINELQGERIDLVAYSPDSETFISNAMSPVKPLMVRILSQVERRAEVLVSDDQLSLAIGKAGQNVRLANKLTNWNLDVRSESQKREAAQASAQATVNELSLLDGVGPKTAEALQKGGWGDVSRLAKAKPDDLTALSGIGEKTAEKIIEAAQSFLVKKTEGIVPELKADEPTPEPAVETEPKE
ncbi:MAG: transcription termination/antitermination protein NusA [Elusimicrobia bacterium]|nr:transcription termination/antitermination protein NusA [Elusimicrobiota bacterium]MBP9128346.1 transcription termination/antitermination protein NusA [Elusimicrobiota bacterium]MBP9698507.1 transcription termination/antitermination protein NusA [Elusimicrobiota bacterium]